MPRRKARRWVRSGNAVRVSSRSLPNSSTSRPTPAGNFASSSARISAATIGAAPAVPMAATTWSRSMIAGVWKSDSSGWSTTFTGAPAARAAAAAAAQKPASGLATKASAAPA
jgi:hypothetical protein